MVEYECERRSFSPSFNSKPIKPLAGALMERENFREFADAVGDELFTIYGFLKCVRNGMAGFKFNDLLTCRNLTSVV